MFICRISLSSDVKTWHGAGFPPPPSVGNVTLNISGVGHRRGRALFPTQLGAVGERGGGEEKGYKICSRRR